TTTFKDQFSLDWSTLPDDGRFVILASTTRSRYSEPARSTWRPDLHVVLWNPFQALDIDAPALLAYGFVQPALDAVGAWMAGECDATGVNPCLAATQ
ncbi:MAG TPA: beta-N-acetylhexosaminidase, partial [Burkholderiaceae bacterium]